MSRASPELDLINAVPAVVRSGGQQLDAIVTAIEELPDKDPTSVAALRLWADALPRLTECDMAIVAASLQLADWWDQNTPDPTLVFGRPVADQLRRAVRELNRDQLEHVEAFEAAARTTARDFEVRITSQVVMPDGGVVTADDRVIPPPPPRRRRPWRRRNRSQR